MKVTNKTGLYTPTMRWEPLSVRGSEGRAWIKTLAKDWETGARTVLVRFDPGYRQEQAQSVWPADIYVVDGEMASGDVHLSRDTYEYRPAGSVFGPITSPRGVTRLVFTADRPQGSSPIPRFIQDVKNTPWGIATTDPTGQRSGVKVLRQDMEAGVSIIIIAGFIPGFRILQEKTHVHEYPEEYFFLEGEAQDYLGDIDGHITWTAGSYVCRRASDWPHGDAVILRAPTFALGRVGWVGDFGQLHQATADRDAPIHPVEFIE